jgi:hypothetical protein
MTTTFKIITCAELEAMEFPPIAPCPSVAPTWSELLAVEPRLCEVEQMALGLHRRRYDWRAWGRIKGDFMPLVGWSAEKYEIRHSAAYDTAYGHLLHCWETGRRPKQ